MAQKGMKIGEKTVTLKRHEGSYNDNNVNVQIPVSDVEDIVEGQHVIVKMKRVKNRSVEWSERFTREIHNTGKKFSIPQDIIRDRDIKPGTTFEFAFYKQSEYNEKISDDANLIDRVEVVADPSSSDGCDQRLYSKEITQYLEESDDLWLKFRNASEMKETTGESHCSYDTGRNPISFPYDVRNAINAKPGDLIEVIATEKDEKFSHEEKIDEIYSMVNEMYDAYLESKND